MWPGAALTFERLSLKPGLWEQSPPPSGEVPVHLQFAQIREERSRDMQWCEVERQVLVQQSAGRRTPPRRGDCTTCGWNHALPAAEGGAE